MHTCSHIICYMYIHVIAERKTSLGKDWHSFCLKCTKCNKTLAAGQHSEVMLYSMCLANDITTMYL